MFCCSGPDAPSGAMETVPAEDTIVEEKDQEKIVEVKQNEPEVIHTDVDLLKGQTTTLCFRAVVPNPEAKSVGLLLNTVDLLTPFVIEIEYGAVHDYNLNQKEKSYMIRAGDRIVGVNGVQRDKQKILSVLKTTSVKEYELSMERPAQFTVSIQKGKAELGLEVIYVKEAFSLEVNSIEAGSKMEAWNKEHKDLCVQVRDRIISVNGKQGDPEMLTNALQQEDPLKIIFAKHH
mmetsp:Transcript_71565/g.152965  ORF Transcript_71565/g.152965 Transcript_71565/m.152965 type:complete len:233 (+) Transcript_71565:80-778(+)